MVEPADVRDRPELELQVRSPHAIGDQLGSGSHALSITRQGKVIALLRKPRTLELVVSKLGPRGGCVLGAVARGHHPKGRSQISWNLHVPGHLLTPGTYMGELVTVLPRGATSDGPAVMFKLYYPQRTDPRCSHQPARSRLPPAAAAKTGNGPVSSVDHQGNTTGGPMRTLP